MRVVPVGNMIQRDVLHRNPNSDRCACFESINLKMSFMKHRCIPRSPNFIHAFLSSQSHLVFKRHVHIFSWQCWPLNSSFYDHHSISFKVSRHFYLPGCFPFKKKIVVTLKKISLNNTHSYENKFVLEHKGTANDNVEIPWWWRLWVFNHKLTQSAGPFLLYSRRVPGPTANSVTESIDSWWH